MKEYNKKTKRWEEPIDIGKSLKRRETCRGGKPHAFELVLPKYIATRGDITQEGVEMYYKSEEEKNVFMKKQEETLAQFGIIHRVWHGPNTRHLRCSVCGKEEYAK